MAAIDALFPVIHENVTIDFHELLDLPENVTRNASFCDRTVMDGYGRGFTGCVQRVGGIDGHLYTGGMASPAFRRYPDCIVDAGGVLAEGCHVFEEFLLCKSIGECVDIFKPSEDGAKIGEFDDVAGVKFLAQQDGVFEDFLGRGPDCYAHAAMIADGCHFGTQQSR